MWIEGWWPTTGGRTLGVAVAQEKSDTILVSDPVLACCRGGVGLCSRLVITEPGGEVEGCSVVQTPARAQLFRGPCARNHSDRAGVLGRQPRLHRQLAPTKLDDSLRKS